jgi:hypothetical protein
MRSCPNKLDTTMNSNQLMPVLGSIWPYLLLLLGVAMLTMIMLRMVYRKTGRRPGASLRPLELQPRPASKWDGSRDDPAARIDRELVQLEEFRREVLGEVDTKLMVLREMMSRCDEKIARLEQLLVRSRELPEKSPD